MPAMERSLVGPYFSSRTRLLPSRASSVRQPWMNPSCWRSSAMCALSLEYGIATVSWKAEFALRRRVSMSAIGTVIVMADWPFFAAVSVHGPFPQPFPDRAHPAGACSGPSAWSWAPRSSVGLPCPDGWMLPAEAASTAQATAFDTDGVGRGRPRDAPPEGGHPIGPAGNYQLD